MPQIISRALAAMDDTPIRRIVAHSEKAAAYMADGYARARGSPLEWHYYSHGNHGFASPDTVGYQPELARSTWPMVVKFLEHHLRTADC